MKGGKDEEKNMGPMFPRLHVNDTDKGGPRAPPRNKMALYEQLSIPSQRFNSGSASTLPAPPNNSGPLVPSASLGQGVGQERTVIPPFYAPPTATHSDDNLHSHPSDGMYLRTTMQNSEPTSMKFTNFRSSNASVHPPSTAEYGSFSLHDFPNSKNSSLNKLGNDDDLSVPTFVNPGITPCSNKEKHNVGGEKLTPFSPTHRNHSTEISGNGTQKAASATCSSSTHHPSARDKHLKRTNTTDLWSRQHFRDHTEENLLVSVTSKDCAENTALHPLTREKFTEPLKDVYASPNREHRSSPLELGELRDSGTNAQLLQVYRAGFQTQNTVHNDELGPIGKGNGLQVRSDDRSRASLGNDHRSSDEYREDRLHGLLQVGDMDRNDDASDTSMVDSISGFDISPDDVVGVIGQKHFWKARRAIVNQQRLFAVQVFELHRLVKVQKLIAGSPHLLLEDTAYLSKPSLKASPAKKLASEYVLKTPPNIVKQKAESQKPNQSIECAAENIVAKPSLPSASDGVSRGLINQQSSHGPYSGHPGNLAPAPVTDDNKAGWSFQPPQGNQWLVPVMSPSEGLVYKPYTGHCPPTAGFMAPMYGGCGPLSLPSVGGDFLNPYGLPASHHHGIGVLSGAPQLAQTYFSPYGVPIMNPVISASSAERMNAGAQSQGHAEQLSTGKVNSNMHSQTSRNISNQKNEAISSRFPKFQTSKESEIQGSTASSPCEKSQGRGAGNVSEGKDALPLFPIDPATQGPEGHPQTCCSDQQHTRVIKVVPHNPRSATESAARIFQSIQEERQQYDSV